MASVSRINGFRPVKSLIDGWIGNLETVFVPASDSSVIMVGDPVKQLTGAARNPSGAMGVTRISGATDVVYGIVVGISFEGVGDTVNVPPVTDLNTPVYRRASTDRYLLVVTDPNVIFEVQLSTSGNSASTVTGYVGKNASPTTTAGSTTSGASGVSLDTTTVATTSTLSFKIVGFPNRPDNQPGDTYFSVYVKLNAGSYAGAGTAGV